MKDGNYGISSHARDEAIEDDLHLVDIESGILTGRVRQVQKGDKRGPKYVVEGRAADLRRDIGVVVRFKSKDLCVIITVYETQEE